MITVHSLKSDLARQTALLGIVMGIVTLAAQSTEPQATRLASPSSALLPNGTPVAWMNRYGFTNNLAAAELADPDGDGVPNWQEYQTGTNPTNRNSAFLITEITLGNGCTLGFNTEAGWVYQVEYANTLPQWQVLKSAIAGTGNPVTAVDTQPDGAQTGRYYRLSATKPWAPDTNAIAWIAPGTFVMGSPTTELNRSADESPQTTVDFTTGFWMAKREVTQAEYLSVMALNPSYFTSDLQRPVERVSWMDATNYCAIRTQLERHAGLIPADYAYRLPTEAEWEYACRASTTTRFYWGDDPTSSLFAQYAWDDLDSAGTSHPVGQKQPNSTGLYDMSGNVWEFCQDWYGTYAGGSASDPKGPASGSYRVIRGGGWHSLPKLCRSANRGYCAPDYSDAYIGFRVVLSPTP